ncbi:hypothetical protein CERSUDRAFT_98780 [Gelatoporia subvermispora B]|uniref:Uncharacterized protein n=1 Tax=Ceriporiopsis subvermispora (strain B) TaxID=914234 RepID=M2QLZ3_CERS8|nr:hypothetical protein CERSUDRAFT_98780 [Gelatoporia subvermispora B]
MPTCNQVLLILACLQRIQFMNNLRQAISMLGENRLIKSKIKHKFDTLIAELVCHHTRSAHHEERGAVNDDLIEVHDNRCDCHLDDSQLDELERPPRYSDNSKICDIIDRRARVREPHIGEHQDYHLQSSLRLQEELRQTFHDVKRLRDLAVETQTILQAHTATYEYDLEPYSEPDCLDCQSSPMPPVRKPRNKNNRKRAISDTAAGSAHLDTRGDKRRKTM